MKEGRRQYYQANGEKMRNRARRWAEMNPERKKSNDRQYRENNLEKKLANNRRRRARERGAAGSFATSEWLQLCESYNNRCLCCAKAKKLAADHIVPLSAGGTNHITNIQPLCISCNSSKNARTIDYRLAWLRGDYTEDAAC